MSETKQTAIRKRQWSRDKRQNLIIVIVLIVMMLIFGIMQPNFLKPANIIALLVAAVPIGLIGMGECLCLLTGQFDMSCGMVAALAGIIWTMLVTIVGVPLYLAFFIGLFFGFLSGLFAGVSVAWWGIPAWMATYALFQIWKGIIYILTNGEAVKMIKYKAFKYLGQYKLLGTPITWAVVILIFVYVLMYFILRYTKFGRDLFVIGGNREAAKNVGINIRVGQAAVFVISGVLSALAGLLFASRSGSGQPAVGKLYAMQGIAGAVIGGTSMMGGKTNMAMTFVGIMIMVCMQNGLNMIAVPSFYQHIATGVIMVLAILVQTNRPK